MGVGQEMCLNNAKGNESTTKLVQRDGHQSKILILRKQSPRRIKMCLGERRAKDSKQDAEEHAQVGNAGAEWGIFEAQH